MSMGIVVCSVCNREVHQESSGWIHCDDKTPRCAGAVSAYPDSLGAIVGKWCGRDGEAAELLVAASLHALGRKSKRAK